MKTNKKEKRIENLFISEEELKRIRKDLLVREYASFEQVVKSPLKDLLPLWLNNDYPDLRGDLADLRQGVYRRIKNDIKKNEAPSSPYALSKKAGKYLRVECESTLPTAKNIKNNLGLTKTKFKEMVARLQKGDETIVEKVYLAHFEKCVAIVAKHSSCPQELAYECTMDALLEIRTDMQKGRISYGNLESYFTARAMNKFYKKDKKKKIAESAIPDGMEFRDESGQKDPLIEKDLNRIVQEGMSQLGQECQHILQLFYYQDLKMMEIGTLLEKSHQSVRKQASRCREKLKKYLGEKFYEQFSNHFS